MAADVVNRADEVDRNEHVIEAHNWTQAADRSAAAGNYEEAQVFAAVAQSHAAVAAGAAVAAVAAGAAGAAGADLSVGSDAWWKIRNAAYKAVRESEPFKKAIAEKVTPLAHQHRDQALELFEQLLDPAKAAEAVAA